MKKLSVKKNLPLIITGLVALGLVSVAAYVHLHRPKTVATTTTPASSASTGSNPSLNNTPSHPGAGAAGSANGTGATSGSTSPSSTPSSTPATDPKYNSTTLAAPTQTFNKSHTPISLSQTDTGQPDYPLLNSTCTSVAAATCEIHATMGSTTIVVVPATSVDPNTYGIDAQWNAKTLGLTVGTWTISAIAKKDGQSSTSTATYNLTVNP